MIRLKCVTQLELDLLLELMTQYHLAPVQVSKGAADGVEIILKISDDLDSTAFFSKLMLYDIDYSSYRN